MYIEEKLPSGIEVVCNQEPNFHSVSIGLWVRAGSVTETDKENGISHLIEHMLFKGTEKRTAKQIAIDMDNLGGQINAFTSKECTCYYIKVIDEKMKEGIEVLSDLFLHSVFDEKELEKEKGVVLEEIAMYNDTPDEVAHEIISSTFFKNTHLEKTILGPSENIKRFTRKDILDYKLRHYGVNNMVIAVAGNFDKKELMDTLNSLFSGGETPAGQRSDLSVTNLVSGRKTAFVHKDIEQVHLCMGFPGCSYEDPNRYALSVLNNILGASMSSRLFQKIREEKGLAYSIYSYPSLYATTGMFAIYAGTTQKNTETVIELTMDVLKQMKNECFTKEEFEQSKEQLKGNYILALESTSAKMNAIGKAKILTGKITTEEETLELVNKVGYDELVELTNKLLDFNACTITTVGKYELKPENIKM